jgi:hypothetical protein
MRNVECLHSSTLVEAGCGWVGPSDVRSTLCPDLYDRMALRTALAAALNGRGAAMEKPPLRRPDLEPHLRWVGFSCMCAPVGETGVSILC